MILRDWNTKEIEAQAIPVVAFGCGKAFSFFFNDFVAAALSKKLVAIAEI